MADSGGIAGLSVSQEELLDSGINVFQPVAVEASMENGADVTYRTVANINNSGPYEFYIPKDDTCFFLLNQTRLIGSLQVERKDGTALTPQEDVSIANFLPACLFRQVFAMIFSTIL